MLENKLLLADANFSCLPIIRYLASIDSDVVVCGAVESDPCHKLADESIVLDYSDTDLLDRHILASGYSRIVPGCNDVSYMSCARVAEKRGFGGFDDFQTALILHHKDKFRAFSKKKGYPVPGFADSPANAGKLNFPVLVKPIDAFSGRGVSLVHDSAELESSYRDSVKFSTNGQALIEEFIDGALYSHSAFIKRGKIVKDFFVAEFCTVYEYQVNSSCLAHDLPQSVEQGVRAWCERMAGDLSLVDGLVHTQFILRDGIFWILEVTRRCPGDLYSELIRRSTGVEYASLYAMPFVGKELPDKIEASETRYIARHTASRDRPIVLVATGMRLPNVKSEFVAIAASGSLIKSAPFGKSGIFFLEFSSKDEMNRYTANLKNYVYFDGYEPAEFDRLNEG